MNKVIGLNDIAPATVERPNEVGLTLYFLESKEADYLEKIKNLISPQVGGWREISARKIEVSEKLVQMCYQSSISHKKFGNVFIFKIYPQLSSGSYAIQIILNPVGTINYAWPDAASWLQQELHIIFNHPPEQLLGYSVVYRANVAGVDNDEPCQFAPEIMQQLNWVHKKKALENSHVLAQKHYLNEGCLSLVSYPEMLRGGLVYLALGFKKQAQTDHLAEIAFAGYDAELLSIDLFFHKGLFQGKGLVNAYPKLEQEYLIPFQNTIESLLRSGTENKQVTEADLKTVSNQIAMQTEFHRLIERAELSLHQQINGIDRLFTYAEMSPIAKNHLLLLRAYHDEIVSYTRKNKSTIETARTAVSIVEATETKRSNVSSERFNNVLTFVGVFLAVNQVLDDSFAENFIKLISYSQCPTYWPKFSVRVAAAFALTIVSYGVIGGLKTYWRKKL